MPEHPVKREHAHYATMESYFEVAESFDWEPVQLTSGPLNLEISSLESPRFGLFEMGFAPRVQDRTVIRRGYVSFCLLLGKCTSAGISIDPPTLAVMPDTLDFRTTFEPGFYCMEFFFRTDSVANHALGEWVLSPQRTKRELIVPLQDPLQLKTLFRSVMENIDEDASNGALELTELVILDRLHAVLSATRNLVPPEPRKRSRPLLVDRALKFLDDEEFLGDSADLAKSMRVSRRTLELAFQQVIGVSPGRFILTQRLNRVRKALASDSGGVIEVAAQTGFEHPSRFASQYKRLFGELPSETLQRARERIDVD